MANSPPRGSRADAVTESLRSDILAGRLAPGRRLTFPELCATYSVSVGVLRESLVRLVDHGIVRAESNLGFSVMSLSPDDLRGLTAVRAQIEPGFVHEAVTHGSVQWEAELVAARHVMERTPMSQGDSLNVDWVTAHDQFHLALVAGAANRRMLEMTRRLRQETDLYRRWYLNTKHIARYRKRIAHEHQELIDAALSRDAPLAETLVREQIERATEVWLEGKPTPRPPDSRTTTPLATNSNIS